MNLPNAINAVIPEAKVRGYLLSASHPQGRHKAAFFAQFGFSDDNWMEFSVALRSHALEHEVSTVEETPFGTRYVIEGELSGPDGRRPSVRVVWFIESDDDVPRLVTAYPEKP